MRPTDKLAAIRALIFGAQQAQKTAEDEVRAFRELTGARSFETRFGKIEFRGNGPKIRYDTGRLLAWAVKNYPHEVEAEHTVTVPAAVRSTLLKTLESRLSIDGDVVVDTVTGEVCDFATVTPGAEDSVVFTMAADVKAEVAAAVADRVEQIATALEVTA